MYRERERVIELIGDEVRLGGKRDLLHDTRELYRSNENDILSSFMF